MAYVDYSSNWVLDQFFTFLQANQLGANCQHIVDNFSVEHNWNATTADGTHKSNSILGSSINKNPISSGSQSIGIGATWTPTVGVYQLVCEDLTASSSSGEFTLEIFVSGSWRAGRRSGNSVAYNNMSYLLFCDGSNVRITNYNATEDITTYYQKF